MKRLTFLFVVLIAIMAIPQVYAATPTPTPGSSALPDKSTWTKGNCEGPAKAGDPPCLIAPDIADDTKVFTQETHPCNLTPEGIVNCIKQVVHTYSVQYTASSNYESPSYAKIGNWLQSADVKLNPEIVQEATINNNNPQYESHATRRCVYDDQGHLIENGDKVSDEVITIGPIYGIPRVVQYADTMSQRYSLSQKSPDEEGLYNYEQKTEIIDKDQAHSCDYSKTGTPLAVPTPDATGGQISIDIATVIKNITSTSLDQIVRSKEIVVPSKRTPKAEDMLCGSTTCTAADLADSPVSGTKKEALQQTPGFIETFRPDVLSYRPENINGSIQNSFTGLLSYTNNTNTYGTKYLDNSYKYLCNTLFPEAILPDECRMESSPTCDKTTLPDFSPSGKCTLHNTDRIKQLVDMPATVPDGIPPTFKAMLEKLGELFNVPPSSILAVMYHEGAFSRTWFTGADAWTDDNVKKWAMCGETFPHCNPAEVSAAVCGQGGTGSAACGVSIAGFGWLPVWFWLGDENNPYSLWTAVKELDNTRTRETISPCNFLDAAAATAKALSLKSVAVPPAVTDPLCFDVPMTNKTIPGSCTAWNDNTVFQSHVGYAGYCPEEGKNATYPPQPMYKTWVLNWYHAFL